MVVVVHMDQFGSYIWCGNGVGSPSVGSSPFAGAGNGSRFFAGGTAALQNTGSGGGGMERAPGGPASST